ncbi:MAG: SDR family oxidoreductase [Gemmatales bacterium]|nr:SDR family oxidoreductase [Gemmatales bacterium]MDW8387366.1 SDR family NAD(P)-dependent oxidoreductase [Gemmatales bacterium]
MNRTLSGRVALVTGAGVGIGRAIALSLADAGAFVGVHYHRSAEEAAETLTRIRQRGGDGLLLQADLTGEEQAVGVVQRLVEQTKRLDIVVNNAGSPVARTNIEDCSLELWRQVFDVNMTSAFLVTRTAIPHLRQSGHGSIVNILSLSVQTGGSGTGPYAAAKGALQVFTRTLARELAPQVRVNAVMPGVIATRHHEQFSTPAKMEEYRRQTPLERNGTAEEVAAAVRFLVTDEASFITGALLDINGGRFLR